jgi:hypothetical protein
MRNFVRTCAGTFNKSAEFSERSMAHELNAAAAVNERNFVGSTPKTDPILLALEKTKKNTTLG